MQSTNKSTNQSVFSRLQTRIDTNTLAFCTAGHWG